MKAQHLIVFLLLIGLAGCHSPGGEDKDASIDPHPSAHEMGQASLAQADTLLERGQYQHALLEYRKVMELASSDIDHRRACLGAGRSLLKMNQHAAAIAAMKPLPLIPSTDVDCQTLATAGEALLHMDQFEEAESLLEIALNRGIRIAGPASPWMAACSGNLAYAYLKNNKLRKAAALYQLSSMLYAQRSRPVEARKAKHMAEQIESLIRPEEPKDSAPSTDSKVSER